MASREHLSRERGFQEPPRSTVDSRDLGQPLRAIKFKKKGLSYADWKQVKRFTRPYWYKIERPLELTAPWPMSFRVPRTGGTLAVTATAQGVINITTDADFELIKLTGLAFDADGNAQNQLLVRLIDTGSGRDLMNRPIHFLNLTGTGQMPFILSNSILLKGGSTFTVEFTLLVATVTYVYMAFHGVKYFDAELQSITSRTMDEFITPGI